MDRHFAHASHAAFAEKFQRKLVPNRIQCFSPLERIGAEGKEAGHRIARLSGDRAGQQRGDGGIDPPECAPALIGAAARDIARAYNKFRFVVLQRRKQIAYPLGWMLKIGIHNDKVFPVSARETIDCRSAQSSYRLRANVKIQRVARAKLGTDFDRLVGAGIVDHQYFVRSRLYCDCDASKQRRDIRRLVEGGDDDGNFRLSR